MFLEAFKRKWQHVIRGWTTEQVCQQLVKTLTSRSGCSMCDDVQAAGSGDVGEANLFLSHTWGDVFLDTVDAALGAAERAAASGAVFIWFDVFSTSQHSALDIPSSQWMVVFRQAIERMGSVAMVLQPWNDPSGVEASVVSTCRLLLSTAAFAARLSVCYCVTLCCDVAGACWSCTAAPAAGATSRWQ